MKYLYVVNHGEMDEELYELELFYLFNSKPKNKIIFSDIDFDVNKSVFINYKLEILNDSSSLDALYEDILNSNYSFNNFKTIYFKNNSDTTKYDLRMKIPIDISNLINGIGVIKNQEIELGITNVDGIWYFGIYHKTSMNWNLLNDKPHSYSNSLGTDLARSIINIATAGDKSLTLVDPCCGIGTVVIDGLVQGFDIEGYEINKKIAFNAQENLLHFGFGYLIKTLDMNTITKEYDVSIIDIPYGLFSSITSEEQQFIINSARRISKKLILVSCEDMDKMIINAGFKVDDQVVLRKSLNSKFERYISVCK